MTDEWSPERDRDPMDRAKEMMDQYLSDVKKSFLPQGGPPIPVVDYIQPKAYNINQIVNGFCITDQSAKTVYCKTVDDICEFLRKAF